MTDTRFPHRVVVIGEPLHARVEDDGVVIYGPHLRSHHTIAEAEGLLAELEAVLAQVREAAGSAAGAPYSRCPRCDSPDAPLGLPRRHGGRIAGFIVVCRSCGERIGPAETGADHASIPDPERPAAKPSPVSGPSVHLFASIGGRR